MRLGWLLFAGQDGDRWKTAGVVFVVGAFGSWLVEQFAGAGRKKLAELILGDERDRALRGAADAAIKATAAEVRPLGSEQAIQAAAGVATRPRTGTTHCPISTRIPQR